MKLKGLTLTSVLILATVIFSISYAQETKPYTSIELGKKSSNGLNYQFLTANDSITYMALTEHKGLNGNIVVNYIGKYDSSYNLLSKKKYKIKHKNKKVDQVHIFYFGDNLCATYRFQDTINNTYKHLISFFDIDDVSNELATKELFSYPKNQKGKFSDQYINYSISEDSKKYAVIYSVPQMESSQREIKVLSIDSDLRDVARDSFLLSPGVEDDELYSFQVANNGDCYSIYKTAIDDSLKGSYNIADNVFSVYVSKKEVSKSYVLDLGDIYISDVSIDVESGTNPGIYGFYSDDLNHQNYGVFYSRFVGDEIRLNNKYLFREYVNDYSISTIVDESENPKIKYTKMTIERNMNGDVFVIGQFCETIKDSESGKYGSAGVYHDYLGDVVVNKFSSEGEYLWGGNVRKNILYNRMYNTYKIFNNGSRIFALINEFDPINTKAGVGRNSSNITVTYNGKVKIVEISESKLTNYYIDELEGVSHKFSKFDVDQINQSNLLIYMNLRWKSAFCRLTF